ncbi:cytochrome P450 2U1-like [Patiria miniata]|uniref:Cytochrome P450 n=1 Tax=Patiria miniata TaxID=46514 RepID=A0A913ZC72_PATMI|nr:cytochrome P450 2U1-like [Patiria miniata]
MGKPKPGKDGFPPGPKTLPLLGSMVDFGTNDAFLAKWSELGREYAYGSVFSIKTEGRWVVFVTGWEAAREVLVKKGLDFCDKPRYPSANRYNPEYKGIFDAPCNDQWKCQRSFAHTTLRSFGFGKVSLEGAIIQEVMDLMKKLQDQGDKPLYPRDLLGAHTANILFSITFGVHYSHDDPEFQRLLDCSRTLMVDYGSSRWSTGKDMAQASRGLEKFVTGQIQSHAESRVAGEEARDFIDAYLAKIDEDPAAFTHDELAYVLVDLIGAGIESVSFTLLWTLLYMSRYPDIQDKVHEEIQTVIGERNIKWEDRNSLPYSQATLMEIQRAASLSYMVVRAAYTDSTIFDYKIPKGTEVWVNIWSVHHDPKVWKDPETFNPGRFLNEDGTELVRHEGFIPFSAGRRGCMGESLGKMELFIFFTSLMTHFRVETPPGEAPPTSEGVLDFTRNPKPFKVRFMPR